LFFYTQTLFLFINDDHNLISIRIILYFSCNVKILFRITHKSTKKIEEQLPPLVPIVTLKPKNYSTYLPCLLLDFNFAIKIRLVT